MTTKPKVTPKAKPTPASAKKPAGVKARAQEKPATKSKPAAKKPGRPSAYSDANVDAICDAIADGKSMVDICKSESMPSAKTVYAWLADDAHAEFRNRYARAREAQADKLAHEILEISDNSSQDTITDSEGNERADNEFIARSRLRVDSRKWLASKLAPKKYGDKLALGGADDLPPIDVVTKSMTDAERAVRLSRMLNGNPDVLASLVGALKGKA